MNARVRVVITARGGSQGIPLKNLRKVGPHSLIAWSVIYALLNGFEPIVTTDSDEIAAEAQSYGARVPRLREAALSLSDTHSVPVVLDSLGWIKPLSQYDSDDVVVLLEPTSPFRAQDLMTRALTPLLAGHASASISVARALNEHPANAVESRGGFLAGANVSLLGRPRQTLSESFYPEGSIYASTVGGLVEGGSFYCGHTALVVVDAIGRTDIDTPEDLALARWIWLGLRFDDSLDTCSDPTVADKYAWMLDS